MNDKKQQKEPFSWEAFERMAAENPELDVLAEFSFDHLHGEELEEVIRRAYSSSLQFKAALAYSYRLLEHLTKLQLRELTPRAEVIDFSSSGNGPSETLQ